jgi:hypothetical protein
MMYIKLLATAAVLAALPTLTAGAQTFGRYAECTTGRGICGIGIENVEEGLELNAGSSKFIVRRRTDSTLLLKLVKANITAEEELRIFGKPLAQLPKHEPIRIYIDDAVPLSSEVRSLLAIPAAYSILIPGVFVVTDSGAYFITELKLM